MVVFFCMEKERNTKKRWVLCEGVVCVCVQLFFLVGSAFFWPLCVKKTKSVKFEGKILKKIVCVHHS